MKKEPELNMIGAPVWWHHHGGKMRVEFLDLKKSALIISGSAAKVTISKSKQNEWFVDWEVIHGGASVPHPQESHGRAWLFSDNSLARAFGLSNDSDKTGEWIVERYGGNCASQGRYIRWMGFLNIPCPGTGHNGDPNVSILLQDEIVEAVAKLLGR